MKLTTRWWPLCLAVLPLAVGQEGLTGFPTNNYDPYCAMACLRSISSLTLSCSSVGEMVGMMAMSTSSACWASNTPYLTTLAWCMHTECAGSDVAVSKLEYFWETQATGQSSAGVATVPAKWSYSGTLSKINEAPTAQLAASDTQLNTTSLVSPDVYTMQWNILYGVQREGTLDNTYGIAILVTGFGLPVVMTALQSVPYVSRLIRWLRPYLVWPSTFGTYQVRPLPYMLGNAPTIGQGLYIGVFIILNIVFTSVSYQSRQPNAWYSNTWREIMAFVLYRTGSLAYIMGPLLFLFGSRNNILLWMSNWSHATFLTLHRWIGRVFTLQAIIHSILAVILFKDEGTYESNVGEPYWIWGIVATLCAVILTFGSGLFIRNVAYEIFLLSHIVLSVILIVGCWYHYYDLYKFLGGVLDWIYAIVAVWSFDRLLRFLRVVGAGPRRAKVAAIGEQHVRIDIPGIRWGADAGKHVYVYFPTLHPLRPWENHPFSVLPTSLLHETSPQRCSDSTAASSSDQQDGDLEKRGAAAARELLASSETRPAAGISLYVRKSAGITGSLCAHDNLLVFVEGPYPNTSTRQVLRCDRLLLIGGGIGITALLPFVSNHWNVKLAWSLKESSRSLLDEMQGVLSRFADRDIRIGQRLNLKQLLADEMDEGLERIGVVVSGPGGLCDESRAAVVEAAKLGRAEFELEVEAYSW